MGAPALTGWRMTHLFTLALALSMTATPATPAEAMPQLNGQFRTAYKNARDRVLQRLDSVIICYSSDKLVWLHQGTRREAAYVPDMFNHLKTLAHGPLALYALLQRDDAAPLDSDTRAAVEHWLTQAQDASRGWGTLGFTPEQLTRQQRILQLSGTFAHQALRRGHFVGAADMHKFTQSVRPLVYENTREAARVNLDALHKQVQAWRKEMGEAAWAQLRAVVVTSHMAARQEVSVQYFKAALQQADESDRLAFAEYPCDDARALEFLAMHVLDGAVGRAFFDDAGRMHRDVMADATQDYLNALAASAAP